MARREFCEPEKLIHYLSSSKVYEQGLDKFWTLNLYEAWRSDKVGPYGMAMNKKTPKDIDDYMDRFPKEVRQLLQKMRLTIRKAAPRAKEAISYGIPALTLDGYLVHFAAWKDHIGFYPGAAAIRAFEKELSTYKVLRGTVQFPLVKPLPLALVSRIVKFRVKQNLSKKQKK